MSAHLDEAELQSACELKEYYRKRAAEAEAKVASLEGVIRYLEADRDQLASDLERLRRAG